VRTVRKGDMIGLKLEAACVYEMVGDDTASICWVGAD